MQHYIIVPGLGNSGPNHWQSIWQKELPNALRVEQANWDRPVCDDWVRHLAQSLEGKELSQTILIGHSLGCIAIVHWAHRYRQKVKGAFLVAPADIERPAHDFLGEGFTPVPLMPLPFRSKMIVSTNDPWLSVGQANVYANGWESELHWIGEAGHINGDAGYGPWPEGKALLQEIAVG